MVEAKHPFRRLAVQKLHVVGERHPTLPSHLEFRLHLHNSHLVLAQLLSPVPPPFSLLGAPLQRKKEYIRLIPGPSVSRRPPPAARRPPSAARRLLQFCVQCLDVAVKVVFPREDASPAPATPVVAAVLRLERLGVRQRLGLVPLEVLPCREGSRAAGQGARVSRPLARPVTTSARRSVVPDAAQSTVYGCILLAPVSIRAVEPRKAVRSSATASQVGGYLDVWESPGVCQVHEDYSLGWVSISAQHASLFHPHLSAGPPRGAPRLCFYTESPPGWRGRPSPCLTEMSIHAWLSISPTEHVGSQAGPQQFAVFGALIRLRVCVGHAMMGRYTPCDGGSSPCHICAATLSRVVTLVRPGILVDPPGNLFKVCPRGAFARMNGRLAAGTSKCRETRSWTCPGSAVIPRSVLTWVRPVEYCCFVPNRGSCG